MTGKFGLLTSAMYCTHWLGMPSAPIVCFPELAFDTTAPFRPGVCQLRRPFVSVLHSLTTSIGSTCHFFFGQIRAIPIASLPQRRSKAAGSDRGCTAYRWL